MTLWTRFITSSIFFTSIALMPTASGATLALMGIVALDPAKASHVNPRYAGIVRDVFKSVGDRVTAGERLAVLESNSGLQVYPLLASINGQVIDRNISVGEFVDQDREAFAIADLNSLVVELTVRQSELGKLQIGRELLIRSRDKLLETKVVLFRLPPVVDEHSRAGIALATLDNKDALWRPGQMVDGYLELEEKP